MLLNHAGNWLRRNYSHGCLHTACLFWCSWVFDFAKLPSLQPASSCCCCFLLLAPLPFVKTAGNHSFSSGHQIFSVVLVCFSLAVMDTMLISHSGEKRAHHWGGKSRQNLHTGTWSETTDEHCSLGPLPACTATFLVLRRSRSTCLGIVLHTMGWVLLYQSLIK